MLKIYLNEGSDFDSLWNVSIDISVYWDVNLNIYGEVEVSSIGEGGLYGEVYSMGMGHVLGRYSSYSERK